MMETPAARRNSRPRPPATTSRPSRPRRRRRGPLPRARERELATRSLLWLRATTTPARACRRASANASASTASRAQNLPWVEYTGRNALIIGLGIFPVVFVVMYVSAKLFGPRAGARRADQYATALYDDPAATLDDLSEAVTTLEDAGPIARRACWARSHPVGVRL